MLTWNGIRKSILNLLHRLTNYALNLHQKSRKPKSSVKLKQSFKKRKMTLMKTILKKYRRNQKRNIKIYLTLKSRLFYKRGINQRKMAFQEHQLLHVLQWKMRIKRNHLPTDKWPQLKKIFLQPKIKRSSNNILPIRGILENSKLLKLRDINREYHNHL